MADYIDREKLIRDLIDKGFYPALVKRAIENAPAVSIVLRSELETKAKQEVAREILGEIDFVFKTIKMEIDTHIGEAIVENEMSTANAIQYGKDVVCVAEKALLMALKKNIGEKK